MELNNYKPSKIKDYTFTLQYLDIDLNMKSERQYSKNYPAKEAIDRIVLRQRLENDSFLVQKPHSIKPT